MELMSEEVIKILDHISQQIGVAIDWSSQNVLPQLTELAHKYTQYKIVSIGSWIVVDLLGIALSTYVIIKLLKAKEQLKKKKEDTVLYRLDKWGNYEYTGLAGVLSVVSPILFLLCIFHFMFNIYEVLPWVFVPELQLIKEFGLI